jgi:hypothetical protein
VHLDGAARPTKEDSRAAYNTDWINEILNMVLNNAILVSLRDIDQAIATAVSQQYDYTVEVFL